MAITEPLVVQGAATFRDPQGRLYRDRDRILREIYPEHAEPVLQWIRSGLARRWMREGRMCSTTVLDTESSQPLTLEHERVFFPTYPWEWTPGQWKHAAGLTLDLCEESLDSGYILKDATPLNILFSGPQAVFVDVLSFERRDLRNPIWLAYGQFVRAFLLPLAAHACLGWPLAGTQHRRDGFEPTDLAPWLSLTCRWHNPMRSLVTIPLLLESSFLQRSARVKSYRPEASEDVASLLLRRTLRKARMLLNEIPSRSRTSRWSGYTETAAHLRRQGSRCQTGICPPIARTDCAGACAGRGSQYGRVLTHCCEGGRRRCCLGFRRAGNRDPLAERSDSRIADSANRGRLCQTHPRCWLEKRRERQSYGAFGTSL